MSVMKMMTKKIAVSVVSDIAREITDKSADCVNIGEKYLQHN